MKISYIIKKQSFSTTCTLAGLEWTSSHQCTSWGWGYLNCFGDEPKTHPPLPKVFGFFSLFSAQIFFLPTYLPPTYFPPPTFLLPTYPLLPPSHLPPPSYLFHLILHSLHRQNLKREPPSSKLGSAWSGSHHFQSSKALEGKLPPLSSLPSFLVLL